MALTGNSLQLCESLDLDGGPWFLRRMSALRMWMYHYPTIAGRLTCVTSNLGFALKTIALSTNDVGLSERQTILLPYSLEHVPSAQPAHHDSNHQLDNERWRAD